MTKTLQHTEAEIREKIKAREITGTLCNETQKPIFYNDNYYVLATERYSEGCDINEIIKNVTKGKYSDNKTLYAECEKDGDSDFFYCSTFEDYESIYQDIIDEETYYIESGEIVNFELI